MPPDPNARLIKAVEGLTRSVDDNTKQLKEFIRLEKRRQGLYSFRQYQEGDDSNAETHPPTESIEYVDPGGTGPYQSGPPTPYS